MAAVSKEDFARWKMDPVTRAFFEAAQIRIEDAKDVLASSAGNDSGYDRQLVGMILAYREMQSFHIEDIDDQTIDTSGISKTR